MEGPGVKGGGSGSWVVGGTRAGQTGNRKQLLGQGWEWLLTGVSPGNIGKGMGCIRLGLKKRHNLSFSMTSTFLVSIRPHHTPPYLGRLLLTVVSLLGDQLSGSNLFWA